MVRTSAPIAVECPGRVTSSADASQEAEYEAQHVHRVYEEIADHFSATRYKPWPRVRQFLTDLPAGSVGVDVGGGNGKYLGVNNNICMLGSDRSSNLTALAKAQTTQSALACQTETGEQAPPASLRFSADDAFVADGLDLPHPGRRFDFAISVAVIHHLSTLARRVAAIGAVLQLLRCGVSADPHHQVPPSDFGRALFVVWALEQRQSRRGWDEGDAQDVLVPWVSTITGKPVSAADSPQSKVSQSRVGIPIGNDLQRCSVSPAIQAPAPNGDDVRETVHHRYYHLYRQGELERDIVAAGGQVLETGYERDNWWAIARPA